MKNNYAQQLAWFNKEERPRLVKDIQVPPSHIEPRFASPKPAHLPQRALTNPSNLTSQNAQKLAPVEPVEPERELKDDEENIGDHVYSSAFGMYEDCSLSGLRRSLILPHFRYESSDK
jgi:hypothetical protein